MKILHTSDWHLGRHLYGRRRYAEFEAFLDWLAECMTREQVDVLLVAGDVFDTTTPSNRAQALYYRFLCRIAESGCRHVVIIAGNHDSPSFLDAPKALLKAMNIHVVGAAGDDPADELILLQDQDELELVVCAAPYLRDRDLRRAEAGESLEDKEQKLIDGIRQHYHRLGELALQQRAQAGGAVPIIGMGHLFAAGGKTQTDDGVRELYVGSLAHVGGDIFPDCFDYLALGHLHIPQTVGGSEWRRYSGSPLPMGFGEAKQQKSVCLLELNAGERLLRQIEIPCFQALERIQGNWLHITERLSTLAEQKSKTWLEIIYTGEALIGDLRQQLEALAADTELEILRIKNQRILNRALQQSREQESLDELSPTEVFERRLQAEDIPDEQRPELLAAYQETLNDLLQQDPRAE